MELDEAADVLYGAGLDEFVAERTRLAKELRDDGKRDEAAQLAKLRKPNIAAWALNQLARRNRRDVDLLLDAGHRLREAQAGVLSGAERKAFEDARKTESETVRRLMREAEQLTSSAAALRQIGETLRTAAVSEEGRELLARGRFTEPMQASGFELLQGMAPAKPATRKAPTKDERRAAQEAAVAARAALREAERELRDAEREAERLRKEWEDAQARVERAARKVERLRD